MNTKKYEIDTTQGKMFGKIIAFSIPLMLTGILQVLFNAADTIVVGRYAGDNSLAAVGSTSSLTNLIINLFIGMSQGTTILVSRYFGARNKEGMQRTVHTAILLSILSGIFLAIFGVAFARPLLSLMGSPSDVIDLATLYLRIYFAGMPVSMLYNFSSGIMRAYGDTKRPLCFLTIAGIVNVILNLIFVIIFKMDVAGVAIATVISQAISAFLNMRCLLKIDNDCRVSLRKLKIHKKELFNIARLGIPAGIQGSMFSITNVLIQSAVNSFGSTVMAAHSAAASIEGIIYTAMNAFGNTTVTVCSQNFGARKKKRILRGWAICIFCVTVVGLGLGMLSVVFAEPLMSIYTSGEETIRTGAMRIGIEMPFYFLCGIMEVSVGALRGIGFSLLPMFVSMFGACIFRITWQYTIFAYIHTLPCLYASYPASWLLTGAIQTILFITFYKKLKLQDKGA